MTTPDKEEMPTDMTEGQFRKKPVVVDAVQLRQRFLWPDWFHDAVSSNVIITHGLGKYGTGPVYCEIKTLEGVMRANAGDWVVRGTQGEIYPCKPDIFIEIYEPVGIATAFNAYEPMREALILAEKADRIHSKCQECEDGAQAPEACGDCFPSADDARVARRNVLKSLGVRMRDVDRARAIEAEPSICNCSQEDVHDYGPCGEDCRSLVVSTLPVNDRHHSGSDNERLQAVTVALEALIEQCRRLIAVDAFVLRDAIYEAHQARAALKGVPQPASSPIGYLYLNPDTGTEFSENHPVESGECDDAEDIREATAEALRDELLAAWRASDEAERDLTKSGVPPPASEAGKLSTENETL